MADFFKKQDFTIVAYGCRDCPWMVTRLAQSQQDIRIQMDGHRREMGHAIDPDPALVRDPWINLRTD